MNRTTIAILACLWAAPALAQFSVPRKADRNRAAPLPTTFAWYGDSIAAGACSATSPTAKLRALLGAGWWGSTDAGDGGTPAIGAYTAAQIRARYEATRDTACVGERCGVYVVEGGVNSIINGLIASDTLTDMLAIVDDLRSLSPRPKIVWFGIGPFRGGGGGSDAATIRALSYNALMADACALRPEVKCVFWYGEFEDPAHAGYLRSRNHDSSPDYNCDGIHLIQAGTDRLSELARAAIQGNL